MRKEPYRGGEDRLIEWHPACAFLSESGHCSPGTDESQAVWKGAVLQGWHLASYGADLQVLPADKVWAEVSTL